MSNKSKFIAAAGILALSLGASAIADNAQAKKGMEKCFGVTKAGKNDCGASDGSHSCAGAQKADYSAVDWKYVPTGTCDKLKEAHEHDDKAHH